MNTNHPDEDEEEPEADESTEASERKPDEDNGRPDMTRTGSNANIINKKK